MMSKTYRINAGGVKMVFTAYDFVTEHTLDTLVAAIDEMHTTVDKLSQQARCLTREREVLVEAARGLAMTIACLGSLAGRTVNVDRVEDIAREEAERVVATYWPPEVVNRDGMDDAMEEGMGYSIHAEAPSDG